MTPVANIISHRTVPLSALWLEAPNWTNPRLFSGKSDKELAELGGSLKAKGINEPLKVQKIIVNGETVDLVIDGQRRVLAGREVLPKNAPIPVVDIEEDACELTPEKADELMLKALTSLEREGLSSFELSDVAERMKNRGKTGEYIAAAIGKSSTWVSRMLKARASATPKLMLQWRKGDITDEQFKELAEIKDEEKQAEQAKEVVQARKDGDKSEARVRSKEAAETARIASKSKPTPVTNGVNKHKPVVAGPQLSLLKGEDGKDKPKKPPAPSRVALDEMVGLADKRPPTSDYVKGLMDGVRYATGVMEPKDFAKAWAQYISRIEGKPKAAKKVKKAKVLAVGASRGGKRAKKAPARKAKSSTGKRKR